MLSRLPEAGYVHAGMACYLCLNPADIIDTGRSIEGEGVLAICTNCVVDLAVEAGMDPQAESEVELMAQLTGDLTTDRDRLAKLNRKLRTDLREAKATLAETTEALTQEKAVSKRVMALEAKLAAYESELR